MSEHYRGLFCNLDHYPVLPIPSHTLTLPRPNWLVAITRKTKERTMKKVINGKRFNTATAQHLCALPSVENTTDFNWHETSLYQTKKGAFFLAGQGNAASIWAESAGQNSWSSGHGLRAVTAAEARQHMESANCGAEAFAAASLSVEEG